MPRSNAPTLVFLHFLGGSSRTWVPVIDRLPGLPTRTLDLPGFGDSSDEPGQTVAEMADWVLSRLGDVGPDLVLVGHSMGAKVSAVLARRAADGEPALAGLRGLVLMAGSPPSPEPMEEATRQKMLRFFTDDPATHREQAQGFVDDNVFTKLPAEWNDVAVQDVLRADPARWRAWLTDGSKEDWSDRVGTLPLPTLILAGDADPCLGPDAQRRLTMPHFPAARIVTLPRSKHLLPLEQPDAVAELMGDFLA